MTRSPCPPLPTSGWPPEISGLADGFAGALNVYRTMAHHPELLRAWAPLRHHVVKNNALGPELSEVAILRTAHRLGVPYEWAHHVERARDLGFSDARIAATRGAPGGHDGRIVRAVDALVDRRHLTPSEEADIAEALGRRAVFDLIALVGFYTILAGILLTYDTPLDASVGEALAARPLGD